MRGVKLLGLAVLFVAAGWAVAADAPPLLLGQGVVDKANKDSLTVRTREPDGRFGKTLVLKLTGTSKLSTLTIATRAGRQVLTQKDTEAKDLEPRQSIAFVYTTLKDVPVLLTAVVQTSEGR